MDEKTARSRVKFNLTGGVSLVLLIFIVLLLLSFASLAIAAGRADYRLSTRYEQSNTGYYEGRDRAQQYLADLDGRLYEAYQQSANETDYRAMLANIASETDSELSENTLVQKYDAGENMQLVLSVKVLYPDTVDGPFYEILSEKTASTQNFNYDQNLNVISQTILPLH